METRQVFWVCVGWFGLLQFVQWALAALRVGLWPGNAFALGTALLVVLVAAYGVKNPERAGGPDRRNLVFYVGVAAAVLSTVALVL